METAHTWSIWDMNPHNPQMTQGNNSITYRCSKFPTHLITGRGPSCMNPSSNSHQRFIDKKDQRSGDNIIVNICLNP